MTIAFDVFQLSELREVRELGGIGLQRDRDPRLLDGLEILIEDDRNRRALVDDARSHLDLAEQDGLLAFAGLRDEMSVGRDDRALAAVGDALLLDAGFIGRDERHAVLVRAHVDHEVGLHVLEVAGIATAGHPGRRQHEQLGPALDQGGGDRGDAIVGADHHAQASDRRVDRVERSARRKPLAVEVPEKLLGGKAQIAPVRTEDGGAVVLATLMRARGAVDDRRAVTLRKRGEVGLCALDQLLRNGGDADDVTRNCPFGQHDESCAARPCGIDEFEKTRPRLLEPCTVNRLRLYAGDGYSSLSQENCSPTIPAYHLL